MGDPQTNNPYTDQGVTLGEINRNVIGVRADLKENTRDLVNLQVTVGTLSDKTKRLEAIVYGSLATAAASMITAIVAVVTGSQ